METNVYICIAKQNFDLFTTIFDRKYTKKLW